MNKNLEKYKQSAKTKIEKAKNSFEQRARAIHGYKYDYTKVDYKNAKTKVIIVCCNCNIEFNQTPDSHINKKAGCPSCGFKKFQERNDNNRLKKEYILSIFKKVHNDKYSYDRFPDIVKNVREKTEIFCKNHNLFFKQEIISHMIGNGCPLCGFTNTRNKLVYTKQEFLKKLYERYPFHKEQSNFDNFIYINNGTKGKVFCNSCNRIYEISPNNLMNGNFCICKNMSLGEKLIYLYLIKNKKNFKCQYRIKECKVIKPLVFDFAIFSDIEQTKLLFLIEYDGKQHEEPINFFGGKIKFEKQKLRDELKDEFCKINNLRLIRISYRNYNNIEKLLEQILH